MKQSTKQYELGIRNDILTKILGYERVPTNQNQHFNAIYRSPTTDYHFERYSKANTGWYQITFCENINYNAEYREYLESSERVTVAIYNHKLKRLHTLKGSLIGRIMARTFVENIPSVKTIESTLDEMIHILDKR